MPRASYTRSAYSAVSQLLYSFRDDEALLCNPLVAPHFQATENAATDAARVRALILASIDRIVDVAAPNVVAVAKRQKYILLRHDLEGVTRRTICADLGITERQLYRDRSAASRLLVEHLRSAFSKQEKPVSTVGARVYDAAEVGLQAALRMRAVGATRSAHERADAIVRGTSNGVWRTAAMCLSAAIAEERDVSGAVRQIRDAESQLGAEESDIPFAYKGRFKAYFQLARGRTNWHRSSEKEHLRTIRKGIDQFFLSQTQVLAAPDPLTQLLVTSAMSSSEILSDVGEVTGHFVVLGDLRRLLNEASHAPEYLDLELRMRYLKSRVLIESDHNAIAREMNETMLRAQQLGFSAVASEAAHYCGWIAARGGNPGQARIFQSNALALADAQDSVATRSMAYASAAFVEELIGTPERALELARTGAAGLPTSVDGFPTYVLARAQLKCGHAEEAISAGNDVVRCASTGELARGATLLVIAQAAAKLGRLKTAITQLDEAVTRLRIFGNTYLLAHALSLRSALQPNVN